MRNAFVFALFLVACSERPAAAPVRKPAPVSAAPVVDPAAEARALFQARCAACHGREGKGDGVASGQLNPKPRSFADPAWQASATDADIEKIILLGGPGVGKSPFMPANPDLEGKTEVIQALRVLVRKF